MYSYWFTDYGLSLFCLFYEIHKTITHFRLLLLFVNSFEIHPCKISTIMNIECHSVLPPTLQTSSNTSEDLKTDANPRETFRSVRIYVLPPNDRATFPAVRLDIVKNQEKRVELARGLENETRSDRESHRSLSASVYAGVWATYVTILNHIYFTLFHSNLSSFFPFLCFSFFFFSFFSSIFSFN